MDIMARILGRSVTQDVAGVTRHSSHGGMSSTVRHQFRGDTGSNHRTDNHRPHIRLGDQGSTYGGRDENGNPV